MYYSEEQIKNYSKPLSDSEKKQCESTIRVIENLLFKYGFAVEREKFDDSDLEDLNYRYRVSKNGVEYTIFLQGSYGNGTCVKQDSDVDIAIICETTFRGHYPAGTDRLNYGFIVSDFDIVMFKKDFCDFINKYYKAENKNKCIFVKGNGSSRKDVDIVPSIRYRDYSKDVNFNSKNYCGGVLIKCNDGREIINYPEQSRLNSVKKNKATSLFYKKIVRILKNIKNDMQEAGYKGISSVSSYGLECLIYNVPNYLFSSFGETYSLKQITYNIITYLCVNIDSFTDYVESNEKLKIFDNIDNVLNEYKMLVLKIKNILEV